MRVRDLGPLLVEVDGKQQPVVGTKGSAMLALLAIHANEQVSTDALTEAAWGEHVSAGAASTLLSHVWRLRQLLEPGRVRGEAPQVLLNDAGGYRLVATATTLDSLAFADAAVRVRDQLAAGRLREALAGADAALALWRGRPYGPAADSDWAQPAVARLDELRAQLQQRRISALVGLGALDTALSDLRPLIAAMPFDEALRALQMEALHRAGRTEAALEAFADTRRTLVDEVGIEPGRDLQLLHRRILDDDPTLAGPRIVAASAEPPGDQPSRRPAASAHSGTTGRPAAREAGPAPVDLHLPPTPTGLVGREGELTRLRGLVEDHRLVTVTGPAGCGKTRLAVEVARAAAGDFADGVWFVDLVGVEDPELVVDVVISTIGFVPSADATPLQDLIRYLTTRSVLVVLDNCEHVLEAAVDLVQAVLGARAEKAGCRVLATSRERLGVPGEVAWTLEPLGLPNPDGSSEAVDAAAVRLLLQRVAEADPTLEMDEARLADVVRICHSLDGLPLPLELAAARAPMFSLAEIADQVAVDPGRLRRPGRAAPDHRTTLRSTIDWSYRLLGEQERAAHRRLSVLPGPFTARAAEAVLGEGVDDTEETLVELVHRSMLSRVGAVEPGRPTTFRQLVTVRSHAHHVLQDGQGPDSLTELEDRRDGFVAGLVRGRPPLGTAAEPRWFAELDDDQAAVRACLTHLLIDRSSPAGGLLPAPLTFYWYYRGRLAEATRWLTLGHAALVGGDPRDLALAGLAASAILTLQGRHEQARPYVDQALGSLPPADDPRLAGAVELLVGLVAAGWMSDHDSLVGELYPVLQDLAGGTGSEHLHLLVDAVGVMATGATGQLDLAVERAIDVQRRARPLGVPMASWLVAGAPMVQALLTGRPEEGIPWAERCMADHFPSGTGAGGAFIENRATYAAMQGDDRLAARLYGAAHSTTRRVGMRWPWRDLTLQMVEQTRHRLGEAEFGRLWRLGQALRPLQVLDGLREGWSD